MITASQLAGFFAAHALWSVSDSETFSPMLAYTTKDDEKHMQRLVFDDTGAALTFGRTRLESNDMEATDAVLIFDGRITLGTDKVDAIILEVRAYSSPQSEVVIAVPYTPKSAGEFRVHKPKLVVWKNCEDFDIDDAFHSFFAGVDAHEEGSKIWNASLDESR
jgi:hypothetical protein